MNGLTMDTYKPWQNWNDARRHDPEPGSPLRRVESEFLGEGFAVMVEASKKQKKEGNEQKPWPKEYLKGLYGEIAAARAFRASGIACIDVNAVLMRNMPGIDHIINYGKFCFSQSKVYISGANEQECAGRYEDEMKKRYLMAEKFIRFIYSSVFSINNTKKYCPKNNLKINALENLAGTFRNRKLSDIVVALRALKEPDKECFDSKHVLVKMVGDAIIFPVPSGIYDKLSKKGLERAFEMEHQKKFFDKIVKASYYVNDVRKISRRAAAKVNDPDFNPVKSKKPKK